MIDDLVKRLRQSSSSDYSCQGCMDTEREEAADRIEKLENALEALSHIHDGNPSDGYADVPKLDYARHMLLEARQIARKALEWKDD